MKTFGLIGFPLSHSFSKSFFSEKFQKNGISDCRYELFPLSDISQFNELIANQGNLIGLNVTIPYKIQIIPYLNDLDMEAKSVGAVNCIRLEKHSGKLKLIGFNTDVFGFRSSLKAWLPHSELKALILGDGGAAKAVKFALHQLNIPFTVVSRYPKGSDLTYADLDKSCIKEHLLIINTTPLGMSPHLDAAPVLPYEYITPLHYAYDLVYNPEKTKFLKLCEVQGAQIKNGYEMLVLQAEKSWEIWNTGLPV